MSSLPHNGYGADRRLMPHLLAPWGHVHRERFFCHLASEVMPCYLSQILLAETVAKTFPSSEAGGLIPALTKGMLPPHNTEGQGRVGQRLMHSCWDRPSSASIPNVPCKRLSVSWSLYIILSKLLWKTLQSHPTEGGRTVNIQLPWVLSPVSRGPQKSPMGI